MTSCTIIISHYESIHFLQACIRQIRKHAHSEIKQRILICDQSSHETRLEVHKLFDGAQDIWIAHMHSLYSGYGIDWAMRHAGIDTDYICQLHVDAFPIHKNWLYLSIKLLGDFKFVGQHQFICDGTQSIYPPTKFFAMSQCFNVARTETYKEMSLEAGFTRFHEREKTDITFKNDDWAQWASHDYHARGTDDDVVAFHWEDKYRQHDKLGFAITGMINTAEQGGSFGRVIEDVVFHFGSARESIGVMSLMPQKYQDYYKRIQQDFTEELLNEMLAEVKPNNNDRTVWDGITKNAFPASSHLNNIIEELKK
jgi:hypothetical protein